MNLKETMGAMSELKDWSLEGNTIVKNVTLDTFRDAMAYVNKIAEIAERLNHHPYILIKYNIVKLILFTHSENAVTQRDIESAKEIDKI